MAPQAFDDCVAAGGKVRTKNVKGGRYMRFCIPKGGGPVVAGEVKEKQMEQQESPMGRKYERK